MAKNLKQKAVSGMIWTALQRYSTMIIQFISGIILARLLTPYDYGCIGMLMIFVVLAESFIDGGFGSALIQKKRPTQEDYSTIFFWNLGMAVLLYAILFFSAPAIARFYRIPLLCDVLRAQGVILFIYAFNVVQRNQLQKKLNFKVLSIVTITTSIISLVVTIVMAYHGYGVWSLVTQQILTALIPTLVFWFYIKWRPKLVFSVQSFKELFSFGGYMFLTHLLNSLSSQINGLFIGKLYNAATMGYFSKAMSTEKLASQSISQVVSQVTFPLYAEVQDDKVVLINMLKRLTTAIFYISAPLMFILILVAKPLFILLYSDRWTQSVPYFQILCLAGLALCLQSVNNQTIAAIGKSKQMFWWTVVKRSFTLLVKIVGLFFWGLEGLLVGIVLSYWFAYFINIRLVSKYIGYKSIQQVKDLFPTVVASILAFSVSYTVIVFFDLTLYKDGILKLLVFVLIYGAWSLLFKPQEYQYFVTIFVPMISKVRRKFNNPHHKQ